MCMYVCSIYVYICLYMSMYAMYVYMCVCNRETKLLEERVRNSGRRNTFSSFLCAENCLTYFGVSVVV